MEVYLGRMSGERLRNELLLQTAWTVALLFASTFMWARVRRRLETTGG
jgi:ABC-type uncharacterized transport system permease subunit